MKLNDDDDDEELFEPDEEFDEYNYDEEEEKYRNRAPKKKFTRNIPPKDDYDLDEEYEAPRKQKAYGRKPVEEQPLRSSANQSAAKVMPIRRNGSGNEICMKKPVGMEDARDVCDILLSGRAVVLNMEGLNLDTAQRIVDFTSGACYAIDGKMQSISRYIFIVTPPSVDLSGDFQEVFGSSSFEK